MIIAIATYGLLTMKDRLNSVSLLSIYNTFFKDSQFYAIFGSLAHVFCRIELKKGEIKAKIVFMYGVY